MWEILKSGLNVIVAWPHGIRQHACQHVKGKLGGTSPCIGLEGFEILSRPEADSVQSINICLAGHWVRLGSVQPTWSMLVGTWRFGTKYNVRASSHLGARLHAGKRNCLARYDSGPRGLSPIGME